MANKKISKSKVAKFLLSLLLVSIVTTLLVLAIIDNKKEYIKGLDISIEENIESVFSKAELEKMLTSNPSTNFKNLKISEIHLENFENYLEENPWIKGAEVYIDDKEILHLHLFQNIPVARIFDTRGYQYYMDVNWNQLPANVTYPYLTPVFTNVPYLSNDEHSKKIKESITILGHYLLNDSFWNAQITQIEVLPNATFELATLMGNHKVILGGVDNIKDKLDNLYIFYRDGLSKLGWDKYQKIDIRFKGQVVTSPGMGYVAPIVKDTTIVLPDDDKQPVKIQE